MEATLWKVSQHVQRYWKQYLVVEIVVWALAAWKVAELVAASI